MADGEWRITSVSKMPAREEGEEERESVSVVGGTDCAFDSTWINESTMRASYVKE